MKWKREDEEKRGLRKRQPHTHFGGERSERDSPRAFLLLPTPPSVYHPLRPVLDIVFAEVMQKDRASLMPNGRKDPLFPFAQLPG